MVKETPKLNETEDNKANFTLNREYFSADDTYSDLSISDLYTVTNPIRKIYPKPTPDSFMLSGVGFFPYYLVFQSRIGLSFRLYKFLI